MIRYFEDQISAFTGIWTNPESKNWVLLIGFDVASISISAEIFVGSRDGTSVVSSVVFVNNNSQVMWIFPVKILVPPQWFLNVNVNQTLNIGFQALKGTFEEISEYL